MDRILELAARQHSVIGREQMLAQGMSRGQIDARVRRQRLEMVRRGVYRIPGSVRTWEQRLMVAVLAAGIGAAASRLSAAALWRLPGFAPGPIEVTQGRGPSSRTAVRGLHDSRYLPVHHVRAVRCIPTTSPERTLFDLCGCVHPARAERALDNALAMELTAVQQMVLMLAETGARGRTGTAHLRELLGVRADDYVPPASELEALVKTVIAAAGIEQPTRQVSVGGTQAPIGRIDFAYVPARILIEADSRRHHSSWSDQQADHRRDLLLAAAGWRVVRVNWHQLIKEPELFIAALTALLGDVAA
jgi:hypothetical protein